VLTLWAFSTDNWKRPEYEIAVLMNLFKTYMLREADELLQMNVRVSFIGNCEQLPEQLQRIMNQLEKRTSGNDGLRLQIALNYGGRDEIVRAMQHVAQAVNDGVIKVSDISEATIVSALDTAGVPDLDFIIRTSGEMRLSGFLLFQAAHSELYFTDVDWPDFTSAHFDEALKCYAGRKRRYGAVS